MNNTQLLSIAIIACTLSGCARNGYDQTTDVMTIDGLDLGTVWTSRNHHCSVFAVNVSGRPLAIEQVTPSCKCVSIDPSSFDLAPGASQTMDVVLDLVPSQDMYPAPVVDFKEDLITTFRDATLPISRKIYGKVRCGWDLSPRVLNLGDVSLPVSRRRVAVIRPFQRLSSVKATTRPGVTVNIDAVDGDEGGQLQIDVELLTGLEPGPLDFYVDLEALDEAGRKIGGPPLRIICNSLANVYASPASLAFGAVPVGDSVSEVVQFHCRDGTLVESIQLLSGHDYVSIEPIATAPNAVNVALTVGEMGFQSHRLVFQVRLDDRTREIQHTVPLRVIATGIKNLEVLR